MVLGRSKVGIRLVFLRLMLGRLRILQQPSLASLATVPSGSKRPNRRYLRYKYDSDTETRHDP